MSGERDDDMTNSAEQPAAGEIVHFNPWRDFNDAPVQVDVFGDEPDPDQIAQFMEVVFGYCEGLIPVRSFIDKGQGFDGRPHNIWIDADRSVADKMATFAAWADREGAAVYVIPGTVAAKGQANATDILQMQTVVVDIDTGNIAAKRAHLERHLGPPTMVVESGGATPEGQRKAHVWWKLNEPAEGDDIARICRLRGDIAAKIGGDETIGDRACDLAWHARSRQDRGTVFGEPTGLDGDTHSSTPLAASVVSTQDRSMVPSAIDRRISASRACWAFASSRIASARS